LTNRVTIATEEIETHIGFPLSSGFMVLSQRSFRWRNSAGFWYRSYGNELWQYNKEGLITHRFASTNDLPIQFQDRKLLWEK